MNDIRRIYGRFSKLLKGLVTAFALGAMFAGGANASEATDVIEVFHENLLTTMQNAKVWGFEKRRDYLALPVSETFNSGIMVRLASGPNWKNFNEEEKEALEQAFYEFSLSTYASRFKGYSGQSFVTVEETPMKKGRVLVSTKLIKSPGDEIIINYLLMPDKSKGLMVVDIYLKGQVSEIAMRKSEFSPIIRDQGFTGLLSLLKEKVENLEAEALTLEE